MVDPARVRRAWAAPWLAAALTGLAPGIAWAAPPGDEDAPGESSSTSDEDDADANANADADADVDGETSASADEAGDEAGTEPAASGSETAADADADADIPTTEVTEAEGPRQADADDSSGDGDETDDAGEAMCPCPDEPEPEPEPDPTHITDFTLSGGGLLTTGNANTLAASGKIASTVRRGKHQYTGGFDGNYGLSRADLEAEWLPTTANLEARSRYDGFFVDWATGFVATTARHDPFQGLSVRWTLDPGVSLYALQRERHTLKFDVGYQLQVDARRRGNILLKDADGLVILDDMGNATRDPELDPVFVNHSLRLAGNYEFKLKDTVKWRLGAEYFQSLLFAEESDRWRINGETGLDVSLLAGLGLGVSFQVRYDNKPLPDVQKLDTFSNVTLTYTFKGKAKLKKPAAEE